MANNMMEMVLEQVLGAEAAKVVDGLWDQQKMGFKQEGKQIILPQGMSYDAAIKALQKKKKEEETFVNVHCEIDAFPLDGAWALMNVLKDRYGWASPVPTPGFFGDTPPTMVEIEVSPGRFEQAFWGDFALPNINGTITTRQTRDGNRMKFVISGEVQKLYQDDIRAIADDVRKWLRTNSIYRGEAIRLTTNDDGELDGKKPPKFIELKGVKEEELVLPELVNEQVVTSLFTPIEHTQACRENKIPLKRGVLLEGPYGTGKTLAAYVTAKKCFQNGWTFIYVDRVQALDDAFEFAKQYAPAVVFAEDIDRAVEGEERTVDIDDVLNTIDGIGSKDTEIITVLTTNHVEKINRAMLRPGRLDAVITFQAPDEEAAGKLVRLYARGMMAKDADVTEAAKELAGQIPAVIREVVERAKLHALNRTGGKAIKLSGTDVAGAARGMNRHLALLAGPKETAPTLEQQFSGAFSGLVKQSIEAQLSNGFTEKLAEEVSERIN